MKLAGGRFLALTFVALSVLLAVTPLDAKEVAVQTRRLGELNCWLHGDHDGSVVNVGLTPFITAGGTTRLRSALR